jgi:hypothetical protein
MTREILFTQCKELNVKNHENWGNYILENVRNERKT